MKRSLRIFCAEDDPLLAEVLLRLFRSRGHRVEHAAHGAEAWGRLASQFQQFDVIVCDHQMPGMIGTTLVGRLRAAGYGGRIVIYSSSLNGAVAAEYQSLDVDAMITKSSRPEGLVAAVENLNGGGDQHGPMSGE